MQLNISLLEGAGAANAPVEVVERKGIGHPDTLCDALAEEFSRSLSRFYLERFGHILHHNVDKGLLFGGASQPGFGGGTVLAPIEIYLTGRATLEHRGVKVPAEELAVEAGRHWLKSHLHALDPERHVRIHCLIRPSSSELVELFLRGQTSGRPLANDTSCGVGFAPVDELETVVLAVEHGLNAQQLKRESPEIGEDIKVMGVRAGARISLTVACALIDRHVASLREYGEKRAHIAQIAADLARGSIGRECDVMINGADGDTPESIYLTVTGTSAESGDDGEVGRGNRATGLITPYRPMSIEAVAGKNPVTHVGKIYNLLAADIAAEAVARAPGVEEACCVLVSRIGRPIREPGIGDLRVRLAPGARLPHSILQDITHAQLARADGLWRDLLAGGPRAY